MPAGYPLIVTLPRATLEIVGTDSFVVEELVIVVTTEVVEVPVEVVELAESEVVVETSLDDELLYRCDPWPEVRTT